MRRSGYLAESVKGLSLRLGLLFGVGRINPLNVPPSVAESRYIALVSALIDYFLLAMHDLGKHLAKRLNVSVRFSKRHPELVFYSFGTLSKTKTNNTDHH